ncbi:MAG: acyl carrier protein [Desulfuromonadales bacterium]
MTDQEIITLINTSLAEEFELEPAAMTAEANLYEDLGLDSLDTVDMVIVLERAFGMKIRDEQEIRQIRTLGDIHRFIIGKKATQG